MRALSPASGAGWRLSELLAGLAEPPVPAAVWIDRLTADARDAGPGALLLAIADDDHMALTSAREAAERGCPAIAIDAGVLTRNASVARALSARARLAAVPRLRDRGAEIARRFFGDAGALLTTIGIAGSVGKTSVGHLLAQALSEELRCAVVGGLGSGFPGELQTDAPTGPGPLALQRELARQRNHGAAAVAVSLTADELSPGVADAARFRYLLFTNLAAQRPDRRRAASESLNAIGRLFGTPGLEWALVNDDDPASAFIIPRLPSSVRLARYSVGGAADATDRADLWVCARQVVASPRGMRILIDSSLGKGVLETRLIGRVHAANLIAVATVLLSRGLPLDVALERVARVRGVPGRLERFGGDGTPLVAVDTARTPQTLARAIRELRPHCTARLLTVLGCAGWGPRRSRALMGRVAERLSDRIIITDDNPRGEDGDRILADILRGVRAPQCSVVARERGLAIRHAIASAGPSDAVLIAGKGNETTQDMGELKVHFSDRAQVVQALAEWRGRPA
jgi:UDP-N-acetylmuramoyl-L-alanyl-D-glutamate--2,6-diaminopimelate ligase